MKITDNKLLSWVAILTLVGYPISASLSVMLQSVSTPINIAYRAIIVLLVIAFFLKNKFVFRQKISSTNKLFMIFWFVYLLRLFYDVLIKGITVGNHGAFNILSYAIGGCLLPFVALSMGSRTIDTGYFLKYFFLTALLSNLLILGISIYQNSGLNAAMFLKRVSIVGVEDEKALVINTILVSFMGEVLFLFSAFLLLKGWFPVKKTFIIAALLLGILNLVMGASRGPILGALAGVVFLFYAFLPLYFRIKRSKVYAIVFFIIGIVILAQKVDLKENFESFNRIFIFIENRQSIVNVKEARDYEWSAAWQQFLENPIFGDKIINDYDQYYPHNIYLEVLQSVGIVGAIPFFAGLIMSFFKLMRQKKDALPYVIIPNIIAGLFSGSLYSNVGFWISIALINSTTLKNDIKQKPYQPKSKNN